MLLPALIAVALLALGLVAGQIALPRIGAARIRSRLTESGGSADVAITSRPAYRLLRNGGDRLVVRGEGLTIGLAADGRHGSAGLSALDGFTEVDIELTRFRTGPLEVAAFVLTRSGGGSYAVAAEATMTGSELLRFGEPWLRSAIPGGGLVGAVAGVAPSSGRAIRVSIEVELLSDRDGLRVGSGGGSIAGYPAGPLATTIAAAVARRLEIVP
jgi:hypothetical protein